ncbi:MAG: TlpA disulfide reductase family protein [Polyangia bacterium]
MIRRTLLVLFLFVPVLARAEVKVGTQATDFDKKTRDGGHLKLSTLRGKVVLVDFWASWCEPCKREIPLLGKMVPKLRERGIEIVTVNIDDDAGKAERFLHDSGVQGLTVVRDDDKHIVDSYEPRTMPSSFVVDKKGVVRAVNSGFDDGDERKIEQQLSALAAK